MLNESWELFLVDDKLRDSIIKRLDKKPEIFSFSEDPLLASFICSLGIQSEMGDKAVDRLSTALSIRLLGKPSNPWQSQIISYQNEIGVCLWIEGVREFLPDHKDFAKILHPLSMDYYGRLSRIVIFPAHVARNYQKRGLDLTIVKDWALSSFLADSKSRVNYFLTNKWEIESNSAHLQTKMLVNNQVAFMGTHDLVDHLLSGDGLILAQKRDFFNEVYKIYQNLFSDSMPVKKAHLVVSYLIGVLLDDMAQPQWYHSKKHEYVVRKSLGLLNDILQWEQDLSDVFLPKSFNQIMKLIRAERSVTINTLNQTFFRFSFDLETTAHNFSPKSGYAI